MDIFNKDKGGGYLAILDTIVEKFFIHYTSVKGKSVCSSVPEIGLVYWDLMPEKQPGKCQFH